MLNKTSIFGIVSSGVKFRMLLTGIETTNQRAFVWASECEQPKQQQQPASVWNKTAT